MEILLYIIAGLFALLGIGIWITAAKTKHLGHILGGLCYLCGAIGAFILTSWWPLLISFLLSFIIRTIFGDPMRTQTFSLSE